MKYIRKFNESLKDELNELCNNYLSFLIDNGYYLKIIESTTNGYVNGDHFEIDIYKESGSIYFKWNDVKDEIIPFLQVLNNDFKLGSDFSILLTGYFKKGYGRHIEKKYKKNTIFRDGINYNNDIFFIKIIIEK